MKLLIIAISNIKKSKSATATLFVLVILSTMLLYIGSNVMMQLNSFIDEKNDKLNGSDFTVIMSPQYETEVNNTMKGMEGYSYSEKEPCILYTSPKLKNLDLKDKEQSISIMLQNLEEERTISKVVVIDESNIKYKNGIVMPYVLKTANGYKTGDEVQITYNNRDNVYTIYGFYEDVMFSNPTNVSTYKMLLLNDCFQDVVQSSEESIKRSVIQTKLKTSVDSDAFEARFVEKIKTDIVDPTFFYQSLNLSSMKIGTAIFIDIIMVMLIAFSLIIMIIALVVIRFAIVTHIESNIHNIGAMQAVGYKSSQLIQSIILEFTLIAVSGSVVGIMLALLASPFVTNMVASTIGLAWGARVNVIAVLVSCLTIWALIVLISYLTSRKMKKITPLVALRSGIQTHNFKKNYLPLHKSKLDVNVSIGLKQLLQNKKQNIVITIIITLLSFASVFAYSAYYNFVEDNSALLGLVGIETADITFECNREVCTQAFADIEQMKGVQRILKLQSFNTTLYSENKEDSVNINVCEDYSLLLVNTIARGRYPIHDNEIAVTSLVLNQLGSKMGDTISIAFDGVKKEYLVVGVTQQISSLGRSACITEEGMKRLNLDYILNSVVIYLKDTSEANSIINILNTKYSNDNVEVVNNKEMIDSILMSFNSAITILCIACIIITAITVILILFLLVKVKVLKERSVLGVFKALGYTTKQLMFQVMLSFFPIILIGTTAGAVLAYIGTNPIIALLLSGNGILNCNFIMNTNYVITILVGMNALAVAVIFMVSFGIRKITPCELFTN